jgi:hypothetical protein
MLTELLWGPAGVMPWLYFAAASGKVACCGPAVAIVTLIFRRQPAELQHRLLTAIARAVEILKQEENPKTHRGTARMMVSMAFELAREFLPQMQDRSVDAIARAGELLC